MTNMPNLESLLASEDTNDSIIKIENFVTNLSNYGDDLGQLSEPQKQFYFNQKFEIELNNGGFEQYFSNSSGRFASETVNSLRSIGANAAADLLQRAIDQFPDGVVPVDSDEREDVMEEIEDGAEEVWDELDQEFYKYADDLNALNLAYIRQHQSEF